MSGYNVTMIERSPWRGGTGLAWTAAGVMMAVTLLLLWSGAAQAQEGPAVEGMDGRTHDLWQRHWRRFAVKMIAFEDDYVAMPLWEPRFPSSRHMSVEMYRKSKTVVLRERFSGAMVRPVEIVPPVEDGRVGAMSIPQMAPGHYGHVHSFAVVEVLGPEEMLIQDVWIVDPNVLSQDRTAYEQDMRRRGDARQASEATKLAFEARDAALSAQRDRSFRSPMRLVGFSTQGLSPGDRWPNRGEALAVSIAVVGQEVPGGRGFGSSRPRLIVAPASWFHRNLTEPQFIDMLKKREMTPSAFVDQMTAMLRTERDTAIADGKMFAELDRRRLAVQQAAAEAAGQRR
jgi:hypothetical protein